MLELENIIEEVGGSARFQQRLLYFIVGPLYLIVPLSWMNGVLVLHSPDHWCNHHGMTSGLNSTQLQSWKECYLLKKDDGSFDGCQIKVPTAGNADDFWSSKDPFQSCPLTEPSTYELTSDCRDGYDYLRTEFTESLVTYRDWVCDQAHNVPNIYTAGSFGSVVGTLFFIYIGDKYSRNVVVWLTTATIVACCVAKVFLTQHIYAYLAISAVIQGCYLATYQLPMSVMVEMSDANYRGWAIAVTCITWTIGVCVLPLIAWSIGDWFWVVLATSLPLLLGLIAFMFVPESPRWLLSKKDGVPKATKILQKVAKVNDRPEPKDLVPRLEKISQDILAQPTYGYLSLFSDRRLTLKCVLITATLFGIGFTYSNLTLNIGNMGGNIFVNFFLLAVVEAPGYALGMLLMDRMGRRWSEASVNKAIPYAGLSLISLFSAISATFLPETLGISLPETVKESAELGEGQKYFSMKANRRKSIAPEK